MDNLQEKSRKAANKTAQAPEAAGPDVAGSLPLYASPRAVHSRTHADVAVLTGAGDYAFAASAPMVQLTVDEFERAGLDYPIVFFGEDAQPYAVTSLEADRNQFIVDGQFRTGSYIPAYLRRYPFVFARDENSDHLILCLDHASSRVGKRGDAGAVPLFEGDEPTAATRQALDFCETYVAADGRTRNLVALLREYDLLAGQQSHYTAPGAEQPTLLLEFQTISAQKLAELSDEAFLRLRTLGALPAIYAQIASQANWERLPLTA